MAPTQFHVTQSNGPPASAGRPVQQKDVTMSNSFVESRTQGAGFRSGSIWAAVIAVMGRRLEKINHWRLVRRDIKQLMEFDDRELADIGLSRGQVLHAMRYGRLPGMTAATSDAAFR